MLDLIFCLELTRQNYHLIVGFIIVFSRETHTQRERDPFKWKEFLLNHNALVSYLRWIKASSMNTGEISKKARRPSNMMKAIKFNEDVINVQKSPICRNGIFYIESKNAVQRICRVTNVSFSL